MRIASWLVAVIASCGVIASCRRDRPATRQTPAGDSVFHKTGITQADADGAYSRGEYDSARVMYVRLAGDAEQQHDTLRLAKMSTQAGLASWRGGRYPEARKLGERALALKIAAGLKAELAKSHNALGLLAYNEGRFSQAIDAFTRAEAAANAVGDSAAAIKAAGNRGLVYTDIGDFPKARVAFGAMLEFARAKDDTQLQGNSLTNLGMVEERAGAPAVALPLLFDALRFERAAKFFAGEENALGQIGAAYQAMGEPQLAIAYLDSALAIARSNELRQPEADDLQLLAEYRGEMGDHARALDLLAQASALADSVGLRNIQGAIARAQARSMLALGDIPGARRRAEAARQFHADAGSTFAQLQDELSIAELARREGVSGIDAEKAALDTARRLAGLIDSRVARVELGLGEARVAELAHDPRGVLKSIERIRQDLGAAAVGNEWEASALEARAYLALGRLPEAIRSGRAAVGAVERVRSRLASGALRASVAADRSAVYGALVLALLRHNETQEAFKVADAARSRALLEHLAAARRDSTRASQTGALAAAEQLLRRIDKLVDLLRVADTASPRRRVVTDDQTGFLSRQLADSRRDYEMLMQRSAVADHGSMSIARGDLPDPARLRASLRPDEAMIEYFVGQNSLVTFVIGARGIQALEAPVTEDGLASRIRLARELVGRRDATRSARDPVLSGLYDLLIAPAKRAGLLDGVRTLIVVPHSALAYLPFSALIDPASTKYLVESFDVLELPSGSSLAAVRGARSDVGRTEEAALFAPFPAELPASRAEVDTISRLLRAPAPFLGSAATESTFRAALGQTRVVHVATHGVLNPRAPMFSRIELARANGASGLPSNDGRLEVHEVLALPIRSPLVFLSGCETGTGAAWSTSFARGDDYATLAEAFLYAGARNVISTLWRIEDRGAAAFASSFYAAVGTKSPVEALGSAQRALLATGQFASPYYWAAYVVSGDGRSLFAQNRPPVSVQ